MCGLAQFSSPVPLIGHKALLAPLQGLHTAMNCTDRSLPQCRQWLRSAVAW